MAIDPRHVGRRYGPYRYAVGVEAIRNFALAVAGGVPGRIQWAAGADVPHPYTVDEAAGAASPYGSVIAPPTFAAVFAMEAFAAAVNDPALGVDVRRLVHGEQDLELLQPIHPGDTLVTTGEIAAIARKGELDIVAVATTSTNQRGEVAVRGTWTAAIRGPPAAVEEPAP